MKPLWQKGALGSIYCGIFLELILNLDVTWEWTQNGMRSLFVLFQKFFMIMIISVYLVCTWKKNPKLYNMLEILYYYFR